MRRLRRPWLWGTLGSLFALYLVLGFFVLPSYLQRVIPEQVDAALKRKATLREVSVNPLFLSVELRDFSLNEPDGRAMVAFRRLLVDFQLSSLPRWAWTFSTIELEGLHVAADIAPDGRFNFAELAASLPKDEKPGDAKPAAPPRLLLQHFALIDGTVTFTDRSGARPAIATLRPLAVELRDLTTLPGRGPYTISTLLPGGGTLSWRGEISLQPIFSLGEISLKNARPASIWRFFEDDLKLAEPGGAAEVSLRYRAAYTDATPELTVEDFRFAMSDLVLTERGAKEPFFALKTIAVEDARFDLARRELRVPRVELRGGFLHTEADARGVLNLQKLAVPPPAGAAAPPARVESPAAPAQQPWRVGIEALRVGELALRHRDFSRASPSAFAIGALDVKLAATLEAGAQTQVTVNDIAVTLSRVGLGEALATEPLVGVDAITLEGGSFDLRRQALAARRVAIKGGLAKIVREADGSLRLLQLLTGTGPAQQEVAASGGKPWRVAVDAFDVGGVKIALSNLGTAQPVTYDIDPLTLSLKNIRNEGKNPIRLEAALRVAQGGSLRVSGEATPAADWSPPRANVRATLERLSLKPLQPLVAARTALALDSGEVSAALEAHYRAVKGRAEVRATGTASVDDLLLKEAGSSEPLLGWKSIAASGIAFDLAPDRLAIADIRVSGLGAKVIVNKDRSVNLARAAKPPVAPQTAPEPVPVKPAPAKPPESQQAQAFPVRVERLRMDKAAVDFADLSLVLPFAAKIQELDGDVLGISTDPASRAVVKLEGRVDEFGLARIGGSLATYDPKAFLDLSVVFRNVEMSPLSAYSVTFAGRRIAAGRLSLDLQYKIDKGALAGDNKVELQNFTLGETVETPGALSLPLDLAVGLLTDAQGRIAISMPVKGNVDAPEFSYGSLVGQALTSMITNLATAPFRALFGGGSEAVESISFDAGRTALQPPEREKLKRVASALLDRPQLKLAVEGQYSDADRAALRQREVASAIAVKLERPSEEPQPVNARDGKTQRALEALFVERSSDAALDQFAAGIEKSRGKEVDRVGALAALTGRASADGAFYDALLARLNDTAPLADDALASLAAARAAAIAEHLEKALSVPAARLERKPPVAGDGERAKLALAIAKP